MPIPVVITVFVDKSFSFVTKTPPVSYFLKKAAGKDKASSEPGRSFVGKVNSQQVREIAENKMKDLNAADINGAIRCSMSTRSNLLSSSEVNVPRASALNVELKNTATPDARVPPLFSRLAQEERRRQPTLFSYIRSHTL